MNKRNFPGRARHIARLAISPLLFGLCTFAASAGPLNLSDNALEVIVGVEPNIMIVNDDSGSMDWEAMTTDYANGGRFTGTQPDGTSPAGSGNVQHRDSNDDGTADCGFNDGTFNGYLYIVEFGSNTYGDNGWDCNTADDEAWRIRNSDFNPMYFDPNKVYLPWEGVDINGNTYGNIDITNAPDNPYNPQEFIDLTRHNSNWGGAPRVSKATGTAMVSPTASVTTPGRISMATACSMTARKPNTRSAIKAPPCNRILPTGSATIASAT